MWSGGRRGHVPVVVRPSRWSIIPAAWSFMLAARARGLGSVWTTFHLRYERGGRTLMQAALIPVAYTVGTVSAPPPATPWTPWSTGPLAGRFLLVDEPLPENSLILDH